MIKEEVPKRKLYDPMVFTNILLLLSAYTPYKNGNYELTILTSLSAIFSTLYHYYKERQFIFFEYKISKLNYLYGILQIIYCTPDCYCKTEILLATLTFLVFLFVGRLRLLSYRRYHILQHIIPSIWVVLGSHKKPFLI